MKITFLSICLSLLFFPRLIKGQENQKNIFVNHQHTVWKDFATNAEKINKIRFFFYSDSIPNIEIIVNNDSTLLEQALNNNFSKYGISVSKDNQGNYFLFKNFSLKSNLDSIFFNNLFGKVNNPSYEDETNNNNNTIGNDYLESGNNFSSDNISIGNKSKNFKKGKVILRGYVSNSMDGEPLPQARLEIEETNTHILTNSLGYYELSIDPGNYTLNVNSLGMYEQKYNLSVFSGGQLNIPLKIKSFLLQGSTVIANKDVNVRSTNMGFERITPAEVKKLPVILGENDPIKISLLLPGVQSISELSSGFNVRGSPADQNIFYINNLSIYNTSHVFGLFTTFNGDAIKEFNFYKSNIPIEFGDHLSSIFDIEAKNGNVKNFSMRGGFGPVSSRLLVEGPMQKDSSSYLISIRSTYSDWLLKKVKNPDINKSSASFKDVLMNFSFQINKKDVLNVFLYGSYDFSDLAFGIKDRYSNIGSSIKWTHLFNNNFKSEIVFTKSRYNYEEENYEIEYLSNKHSFDLNHTEAKINFKNHLNKHEIQYGINTKFYKMDNGDLMPLHAGSSIKPVSFEPEKAISNSIFLGDQWNVLNKLTLEAGIRATIYSYLGPKTIYFYQENEPTEIDNIIDTAVYGENDIIRDYKNLDYRLSGKYEFNPSFSIKASFNKLHQYIFMLSNSVSVSPTNNWKLCDPHIKPMNGEQYSLGFYKNFLSNRLESSIEIYYKDANNLVEYKDGADLLNSKTPETSIIQGNLKAYGIEVMLRKKIGKINGWINYTYSSAKVKAVNSQTGEMINQGYSYPANYDRPHAVNLTLNYNFTRRISISTNIVYSTGRPITYPTSLYHLSNIQLVGFSGRNEYRLPDYFRTDLSFNFEGNLKRHKIAHSYWSLSFYNLTARENPYSIVFQNEKGFIKAYKISLLGTIIPSINFNLKFGNYEN